MRARSSRAYIGAQVFCAGKYYLIPEALTFLQGTARDYPS